MKPITNPDLLPKFLVVNSEPEKTDWNKHLLLPWKAGEMVKVAPEQISPILTPAQFAKKYVLVIRKGVDGKWGVMYSESWANFDLITSIKTINKHEKV